MFGKKHFICLLKNIRKYYTVQHQAGRSLKDPNVITSQLYAKIKSTGPITIANYMKDILINPTYGYYMSKDVFGRDGDFITSPELSQMFGEMIAIWFLNEWSKSGNPKPVQIVELGPGRGTLCQDLLRVFDHFNSLNGLTLHLVEVSPFLSDMQARLLCMQSDVIHDNNSVIYRQGLSHHGVPIKWYKNFADVPAGFTLLVAHEFFDALPIHKFKKTNEGYREILIDIDPNKELTFRYVLSKNETPASHLFINKNETNEHVEVSPDSLILIKDIAKKLEVDGGLGLIADYGFDGCGGDTFRAFKKHKQHDPLIEPGTADLTADVDFSALKKIALENADVMVFGPVMQSDFLKQMGIEHRYAKLKETATSEQLKSLDYGYDMITNNNKMGSRFKFMCIVPAVLKTILDKYPVVGFN